MLRPRALVANEVGCCEIAALIKRDLQLKAPLIAVNDDLDAVKEGKTLRSPDFRFFVSLHC